MYTIFPLFRNSKYGIWWSLFRALPSLPAPPRRAEPEGVRKVSVSLWLLNPIGYAPSILSGSQVASSGKMQTQRITISSMTRKGKTPLSTVDMGTSGAMLLTT